MATFRIGRINTPDPKYFAPILVAVGFSLIVMVFEKDLGSALLFTDDLAKAIARVNKYVPLAPRAHTVRGC